MVILCSLLALIVFLLQVIFRAADDNRLTSWVWALDGVNVGAVFAVLAAGIAVAGALCFWAAPPRHPALALFALAFLVGALFWPLPEVNVDAARYFIQAKSLAVSGVPHFLGQWGGAIGAWTDLPLVPFLYGIVLAAFGEARLAVQVFSTFLFAGTVVLTFLAGRALWNSTVGLYAGAFLLAMPYLLTQVPLMLVDVPAMFFLTLAILATIYAARDGRPVTLGAAVAAIVLAMLCKYSNWLMLSVVPVILVVCGNAGYGIRARRAAGVVAGIVAVVAAIAAVRPGLVTDQMALLAGYQWPALGGWRESMTSTFLFQIHPFVAVAAVAALVVAVRRRDPRFAVVAWMGLLVLVLGGRRLRYAVVALPMLALMAAYGVSELGNPRLRRAVASCAVVSGLVTSAVLYLPFLNGTSAVNLQRAGAYLNAAAVGRVDAYALPQAHSAVNPEIVVPILDYYTAAPVALRGAGRITPPGPVARSPVRFTWDYRIPRFPNDPPDTTARRAVAVISDDPRAPLPEELRQELAPYRLTQVFAEADRAFRFQTVVMIYEPRVMPAASPAAAGK